MQLLLPICLLFGQSTQEKLWLPHCATNVSNLRVRSVTTSICISGKSHLIVTKRARRCNTTRGDPSVHMCIGAQVANAQLAKARCINAHTARCINAQMHTSQDAQMHRCTIGRMHTCKNRRQATCTNGQMHKWKAGRMHKGTDAQMESRQDAQMGRHTIGKQAGCTDAHIESRQDAQMDRCTNGKQAGCTNGQTHKWKAGRMRKWADAQLKAGKCTSTQTDRRQDAQTHSRQDAQTHNRQDAQMHIWPGLTCAPCASLLLSVYGHVRHLPGQRPCGPSSSLHQDQARHLLLSLAFLSCHPCSASVLL